MSSENSGISFETGMLAFARSVQLTEGLFYASKSEAESVLTPVPVLEKGVRGQSAEDNAQNPGKSNPQSVEYAIVPQGHDGVVLEFSARFLAGSMRPHACGDKEVAHAYERLAEGYKKAGGYGLISRLLLWNVANARFAWRNRYQSDSMTVAVEFDGERLVFDPLKLSLTEPASTDEMGSALIEGEPSQIQTLISQIARGLDGTAPFTMQVQWRAEVEPGQEIFPSQEYIREELEKKLKGLSRVYAKIPTVFEGQQIQQASMHSQKIGAALRHIDIWHESDEYPAPISVNPYGGMQETSAVLRKGKNSFYALRKNAAELIADVEGAAEPEQLSPSTHFVMANLIRGGVFGASAKKAKA